MTALLLLCAAPLALLVVLAGIVDSAGAAGVLSGLQRALGFDPAKLGLLGLAAPVRDHCAGALAALTAVVLLALPLLLLRVSCQPARVQDHVKTAADACQEHDQPPVEASEQTAAGNWWRSCCGAVHADDGEPGALLPAIQSRQLHPKFCGLRLTQPPAAGSPTAGVRLLDLEPFEPEPLSRRPCGWEEAGLPWREGERARCEELRAQVAGVEGPKDLLTLQRFFRARDGNVAKAARMYETSAAFHAKMGHLERGLRSGSLDDTLHRRFDHYWKAIGLLGRDRDGDPVVWEHMGTVDMASVSRVPTDFLVRHEVYSFVRLMQAAEEMAAREGRPPFNFTVVVVLDGLGTQHLNHQGLQKYRQLVRVGADHYPELVKRILVVRAPWIFDKIWLIVRHFFDEGTQRKIQLVGAKRTLEALTTYIDPDWIPAKFGGNLVLGGSPECEPVLAKSGPVPQSLVHAITESSRDGGSH